MIGKQSRSLQWGEIPKMARLLSGFLAFSEDCRLLFSSSVHWYVVLRCFSYIDLASYIGMPRLSSAALDQL